MSIFENPYLYLLEKYNEADISMSFLCKKAKVSRATVEKWKEGPPKTLQILSELLKILKKLE